MKAKQKNRCIRLSDKEWSDFKSLLGMEWMRKQIARASKQANKPKACGHE